MTMPTASECDCPNIVILSRIPKLEDICHTPQLLKFCEKRRVRLIDSLRTIMMISMPNDAAATAIAITIRWSP